MHFDLGTRWMKLKSALYSGSPV